MAHAKLTSKKYTIKDAQNQRESAKYIHTIAQYTKRTDMKIIYDQLTFAYENINSKLCVFVEAPGRNITIAEFIKLLDLKKKV